MPDTALLTDAKRQCRLLLAHLRGEPVLLDEEDSDTDPIQVVKRLLLITSDPLMDGLAVDEEITVQGGNMRKWEHWKAVLDK